MARRTPGQIRADAPRRDIRDGRFSQLDGLSPRGLSSLAHLERTRLWPGAATEALSAWKRIVRDPNRWRWNASSGCGELGCCPNPEAVRGILEIIAHALPTKEARAFRNRHKVLDELW